MAYQWHMTYNLEVYRKLYTTSSSKDTIQAKPAFHLANLDKSVSGMIFLFDVPSTQTAHFVTG